MASGSEDSEDEPLSILALKNRNDSELEITPVFKKDEAKSKCIKMDCVSIALQPLYETSPVLEKPKDVWLYLTDLTATGPYSCLLCPEWFINRPRIVIHYAVDHKKDYCGICRYFVPNREAWQAHLKIHLPLKCSQCSVSCLSEKDLRDHFSSVHNLVHCRLCHLRLPDDHQYRNHLQKHFVKNVACINEDTLWDFQCKDNQKFKCLLCSKFINIGKQFGDHFMSYHHLTLRCFMHFISGYDFPFNIKGVDLTPGFIATQLNAYSSFGYVDFQKTIKVKEELIQDEVNVTTNQDTEVKPVPRQIFDEGLSYSYDSKFYKGDEDFDVTHMELIILHQCYYDYVKEVLQEINSNIMPTISNINYANQTDEPDNINCCLCEYGCEGNRTLEVHMTKVHGVKNLPIYWCRVCAAVFNSVSQLEVHICQEFGEFVDLWICQFCDNEFINREETRKHLTVHWNEIEDDNCFSPHLGFKCKFCPTLFWNEIEREVHHVKDHYKIHTSDFYKCLYCDEIFGDKVFFTYHFIDKHGREKPLYLLKCSICCLVLPTVNDMRVHFEDEHPKARKLYCSLDPCKFKPLCHRKSFLLHLKSVHFQTRIRKYKCESCGEQFPTAKARTTHVTLTHGQGKYQCTLCTELLRTSDERKIHYLIRHPGRFEYQCVECNKSFQYKSSLYMHKQEHSTFKVSYACTFCGKVFLKRDSYREHILIHQAPRHACSYCPMRFVQRSNMLRHERRHTGERPYSCKYCPRTFADKGACTSHSRTHTRTTKYDCVYCGQTFAQKSKLKYHIRKHTGEGLETCTVCAKTFTSACSLREHMRMHERQKMEKTVKCPLCQNMYSDEREMLRHLRSSHASSKYKCPLCRKIVTSASSLRDHVISHSQVKTFQCNICPKSYFAKKSMMKHLEKRHFLQKNIVKIKVHYRHLQPHECNLDLDPELMEKIFGNPNKKPNLSEFKVKRPGFKMDNVLSEEKKKPKESKDSVNENFIKSIEIKVEPHSDNDGDGDDDDDDNGGRGEVLPPDFVSVKVECVPKEEVPDTEVD